MAKKKIFVGIEYQDAFDSIYTLIQGNCFEGLPYAVYDGVISDGTYEYVLSDKKAGENAQVKFVFEKDGATWFKALRGEKVPDDDSIWNTFRSNIVIEYHKRFSVVEYKNHAPTIEERSKALATATDAVKNFCEVFYPDYKDVVEVTALKNTSSFDDIYGVAMKIELSGGTGASLPVLGKVYFTRTGKLMTPIFKEVAAGIDGSISSVIPDEEDSAPIANDTLVLDNALDAMQALIESNELNFADYLHFSNKSDAVAVKGLLAKLSHSAVELECQRVDVLYITHIQTNSFDFMAYAQGKPMLKVNLGINDAMSIACASCSDKKLMVDRNQIKYVDANGNENIVTLDFSSENLGVSPDVLEKLKEFGEPTKHFIPMSCSNVQGKRSCNTHKCASQIFEAFDGKNTIKVCKDCPYPEIVYTNPLGEKQYTPSLLFTFDKMDLVTPNVDTETAYCAVCGRSFTKGAMHGDKCPTCYGADRGATEKAKKLFKAYKQFLPFGARTARGEKACYEDDEIILFVVGKNRYVFNKLNVKNFGYVSKPKQIR